MKKTRQDTVIATAGRNPKANHGIINPPVYHASTVLFPTVAELHESQRRKVPNKTRYGRHGTPTTFALEEVALGRNSRILERRRERHRHMARADSPDRTVKVIERAFCDHGRDLARDTVPKVPLVNDDAA